MNTNNELLEVSASTKENIKPIGMILIPGVNDEAYAKYISSIKPVTETYMISIVDNRW